MKKSRLDQIVGPEHLTEDQARAVGNAVVRFFYAEYEAFGPRIKAAATAQDRDAMAALRLEAKGNTAYLCNWNARTKAKSEKLELLEKYWGDTADSLTEALTRDLPPKEDSEGGEWKQY